MTRPIHARAALLLSLFVGAGCTGPTEDTAPDPDTTPPTETARLRMVTLNVESGDANADAVATIVAASQGEWLWGFTELADQAWLTTLAAAAPDDGQGPFETALGGSGYFLRMGLAWDPEHLTLIDVWELDDINVGGTVRAPLVGQFRVEDSQTELLVVVNHLWRTNNQARHEQAQRLHDWALAQDLPAVTLGDFNFDWSVEGGDTDHDVGYDLLTADDAWQWVRPDELVMTQCNAQYASVLDFFFVSGAAQDWPRSSRMLQNYAGYCHDDATRPDHRPVRADLTVPL